MATPVPFEGSELVIQVRDLLVTPAAWKDVDDMNSFQRGSARSTTSVAVFMNSMKRQLTGPRDVTFSISGLKDADSDGQEILNAAHVSGDAVNLKVLWDGTNGFTQLVKVASTGQNADPENFQAESYEFIATAAAVIVGSGPLP